MPIILLFIILLLIGTITWFGEKDSIITGLLAITLFAVSSFFVLSFEDGRTYSDGVKDTLSHKNNYIINYQKVNDSTFIPIDTVIIYK